MPLFKVFHCSRIMNRVDIINKLLTANNNSLAINSSKFEERVKQIIIEEYSISLENLSENDLNEMDFAILSCKIVENFFSQLSKKN